VVRAKVGWWCWRTLCVRQPPGNRQNGAKVIHGEKSASLPPSGYMVHHPPIRPNIQECCIWWRDGVACAAMSLLRRPSRHVKIVSGEFFQPTFHVPAP